MPGTLLFVHGTGTREAGYRSTLQRVQEGAANYLPDVTVQGVPWYESRTDFPELIERALPLAGSRAVREATDPAVTAWRLLAQDPLLELAIIGEAAAPAPAGVTIGGVSPAAQLVQDVSTLSAESKPLGGFTEEEFREACRVVGQSTELREAAARTAGADVPTLASAASRAVVATLFQAHVDDAPGSEPRAMLVTAERDTLVGAIFADLVDASRGLGSWLLERIAGLGTGVGRWQRSGLTAAGVGFFSDIFFYEKRGDAIRTQIAEALGHAEPPVVILGHSLGGIAAVDLLSSPTTAQIELLVTVGSQAPILFAMNALGTLQPPDQNRVRVAKWLNVFDRNDLISFRASEIFALDSGIIEDREVSSGEPFPMSHGAYFVNPEFWKVLAEQWP